MYNIPVDENALRELLLDLMRDEDLFPGQLRYFERITSTNDEALRWAGEGAPHLSLVVADEQTAGRGRMGRRWFTPPGAALAFSLILHPDRLPLKAFAHLTALGALAVCAALNERFHLQPQIKWPNDVLLNGCKLAGVLVEAVWQGEELQAAVLGIGINIARKSVPPDEELLFPATCLEDTLGRRVDRWVVLRDVLCAVVEWLPQLDGSEFLRAWQDRLAFRGQPVQVSREGQPVIEGVLAGLLPDGSLLLRLPSGETASVQAGEVHLRPLDVDGSRR